MSKITIEKSKYKHTVDTIDNSIPIDEIRIDILFKYLASKWFNIPVRVPLLWSILYKKTGCVKVILIILENLD